MAYSIEHIVAALKTARLKKGLSQRALGVKTRVPQSHISKIEQGEVDLQTSSLIEIARALEMELMLVPREWVPSFKKLLQDSNNNSEKQIPKYSLDQDEEE